MNKRAGNKQRLPPSAGADPLEAIIEAERLSLERLLALADPQSRDALAAQAEAILQAERLKIERVLKAAERELREAIAESGSLAGGKLERAKPAKLERARLIISRQKPAKLTRQKSQPLGSA